MELAYNVQAWLNTFTYREGWKFSLVYYSDQPSIPGTGCVLKIEYPAKDSITGMSLTLSFSKELPYWITEGHSSNEDEIQKHVWYVISEAEAHERLEWFKVNGQHVSSPHNKDGSANYSL